MVETQQFTQPKVKIRGSPSGIHLFSRMTGLNVLLDEVKVASSSWASAPRQVSIALTDACDLACQYCFARKSTAMLDFVRVMAWLDELDANGCLGVGFGGGEPTLHPSLTELCNYANQHTGMAVTVTTHGHNFDDALAAKLAGIVHFVRISMDGVGATYEALRGRPFADFLRHLDIIRSLAPFGINYVVNSQTLPDLDGATKLADEFGATDFLLLPEQPSGKRGGIDSESIKTLQQWVAQYLGPVPLAVSERGSEGLPTCNPLPHETRLRAYAHIDAAGILKCSSFDNSGVPIEGGGVMNALNALRALREETI